MLCGGIVLVIFALVLMVVWRVPSLIDEFSGMKAKRQIERMRKLNISSSGLSSSDTAEFYKTISNDGVFHKKDVKVISTTSDLSKMIDDPYGTVGGSKSSNDISYIGNDDTDCDKEQNDVMEDDNSDTDIINDSEADIVENTNIEELETGIIEESNILSVDSDENDSETDILEDSIEEKRSEQEKLKIVLIEEQSSLVLKDSGLVEEDNK